MMNEDTRWNTRRPDRRRNDGDVTLSDIERLGAYGRELVESLNWCEHNGYRGLAEFYREELSYRIGRLPRPPAPRERDEEARQ